MDSRFAMELFELAYHKGDSRANFSMASTYSALVCVSAVFVADLMQTRTTWATSTWKWTASGR